MNVNPSGVALIPVFTALVWIPVPQMAESSPCSSPVAGTQNAVGDASAQLPHDLFGQCAGHRPVNA